MSKEWIFVLCFAWFLACSQDQTHDDSSSDETASASGQTTPADPLSTAPAPAGAILSAWSQIVAGGRDATPFRVVARFVVQGTDQDCGALALGHQAAESVPLAVKDNPDPATFPITLCQAVVPRPWPSAKLHQLPGDEVIRLWRPADLGGASTGPEIRVPGPHVVGRKRDGKIVMITTGDTGCKGDEDSQPHCSDVSRDWPFHRLTEVAVEQFDPDFVIHVGDYRYYEEKTVPDNWRNWYRDFFFPAQDLLFNAPFAFARGNHEQCNNTEVGYGFGKGWFYLLEATTTSQTTRCPPSPQTIQAEPWYFDVAVENPSSAFPQRFAILDTSPNFPDEDDDPSAFAAFASEMTAHFTRLIDWADAAQAVGINPWWVTHRPAISLTNDEGTLELIDQDVRATLLAALENRPPLCDETCVPNTYLAGHLHLYEQIQFFPDGSTSGPWVWPQTMIVGNGGVADYSGFNSSPCTYADFGMGLESEGVMSWDTRHGYVIWTRSAETTVERSGWSAETYFVADGDPPASGTAMTACAASS